MTASAKKRRGKLMDSYPPSRNRVTIGDCHCGNNAGACAFVVGLKH